jgi:hypothetical protein
MAEPLSLAELVRRHNIVEAPISAMDLDSGMVLRCGEELRIVISVAYENTESGVLAIIEIVDGLMKVPQDFELRVWHMEAEPFIVGAPSEDVGAHIPSGSDDGSAAPAHDAAGIVPVWRGPKRIS